MAQRKTTPLHYIPHSHDVVQAINWNTIENQVDLDVWNRLVSNFWVPEKIPVSNDISSWNKLSEEEQDATMKVFAGLTMLDTVQGTVGAPAIMKDAQTPHEEAVYANISFMEALGKDMCVLTSHGWKTIDQVSNGEVVAQFSPEEGNNGKLSFVKAKTVPSHHAQTVYDINIPGGLHAIVSGGHRMYVEKEDGSYAVYEASDLLEHLEKGEKFYMRTAQRSEISLLETTSSFEEDMDKFSQGNSPSPLERYSSVGVDSISPSWCYSIISIINNGYSHVLWDAEDIDLLTSWAVVVGMNAEVEEVEGKYKISFSHKSVVEIKAENFSQLESQEVYCLQVPSTFLYVKHRDETSSPMVTGNCIHAKSYSNIFMTLASTEKINNVFRWAEDNELLQEKAHTIVDFYKEDDPYIKKIASTVLESFLFYSGFYLPLRMSSHGKLVNTADIIRLIIRDEVIHGYYIGYKFQESVKELPQEKQDEYKDMAYNLIMDMYEIESAYTESIYDQLGWTEDVKKFLRYNANKALNNLGYEVLFPVDSTEVSASILASLSPQGDENHDFFSGSGSSYVIGDAEETSDDDWDW